MPNALSTKAETNQIASSSIRLWRLTNGGIVFKSNPVIYNLLWLCLNLDSVECASRLSSLTGWYSCQASSRPSPNSCWSAGAAVITSAQTSIPNFRLSRPHISSPCRHLRGRLSSDGHLRSQRFDCTNKRKR